MDREALQPGLPRSVVTAFQVLEAVADAPRSGVTSLAKSLGLPKSTVQRSLKTLEELGYVYPSGELSRWVLTLKAYELGARAPVMDIRLAALSEMNALSRLTGESINLMALEGDSVIVVEKVDSTQAVRSFVARGERHPAHVSASGKALLAEMPDRLRELTSHPLDTYTPATLDIAGLLAEIEEVKRRGYGVNRGEYREDVVAIGAVIRAPFGESRAAIGISAPRHRAPNGLSHLAPDLLSACDRVSAALLGENAHLAPGGDA